MTQTELLLEFYRAQIEVIYKSAAGRTEKANKYRRIRGKIYNHITDASLKQEAGWFLET